MASAFQPHLQITDDPSQDQLRGDWSCSQRRLSLVRTISALVAGAISWEAVVAMATLLGRLVWPAYSAVEEQRIFTLDMLVSRLAVGALATLAFGFVAAWVTNGETKSMRLVIFAWLLFSVVDHIIVWEQFPVWYHLFYLAYIIPFALLGSRIKRRFAEQ
jgi:hypothetical protein